MSKAPSSLLTFAAVAADGVAAWAFVVRESDGRVKNRFVHSASGAGDYHRVLAGYYALGHGLRWLLDHGRGEVALKINRPNDEVGVAMAVPVGSLSKQVTAVAMRCLDLLAKFKEWDASEVNREDCGADQLARQEWESATLRLFPSRPTGRRLLPGLTRGHE